MPQYLPIPCSLRNHFVYYNLHRRCWSLKAEYSNPPMFMEQSVQSVKGRVTGHADTILAFGVTCKVSVAGRERVIREKRKNVHAGLSCDSVGIGTTGLFHTSDTTPTMSYNPYSAAHFYDRDTRSPLFGVPIVVADCSGGSVRVSYSDRIIRCGDDHFLDRTTCNAWIDRTDYTGPITESYCALQREYPEIASRTGGLDCNDFQRLRAARERAVAGKVWKFSGIIRPATVSRCTIQVFVATVATNNPAKKRETRKKR